MTATQDRTNWGAIFHSNRDCDSEALYDQLAAEIRAAWLVMHKARRDHLLSVMRWAPDEEARQIATNREQHLRALLRIRSAPRRARKEMG